LANQKYINLFVCAVAFIAASYLYYTSENDSASSNKTWRSDGEFNEQSNEIECDFHSLTLRELSTSHQSFTDDGVPTVIKGLANDWKSATRWQKQNLLNLYGNRTIQAGSESSIVYSGGAAGTPILLKDIIAHMNNNATDDFVFDASILQSVPELLKDVQVPNVVREWDTPQNERDGMMWHMLSLGPSRTGLSH
jgi:hypothetical protein